MNRETDMFARWRWAPRSGQRRSDHGYAVEHFKRQRNRQGAIADKVILLMAGACIGGALVTHVIARICTP